MFQMRMSSDELARKMQIESEKLAEKAPSHFNTREQMMAYYEATKKGEESAWAILIEADRREEREAAVERAIAFEKRFTKNLDPEITDAYMQDLRAAILGQS